MGVIMKNKVNYTGGGGSGGASALADLEDVELTTPTDGQALVYDNANSKWINGNVSGGGNTLVIQDASIYSEDEQQVGMWTDGKPLYQKTFIVSNPPASSVLGSIDVSALDIDTCIIKDGYFKLNDGQSILAINEGFEDRGWCHYYNDEIKYLTKYTATEVVITLLYTKTTDTAGSGGYKAYGLSPIIYSEEEREVGVWTDGKPLYQKTFVLTTPLLIAYNSWTNTTIDSSDMQKVIYASGIHADGTFCGELLADPTRNNHTILGLQTPRNNSNGIAVKIITIQYTKTTDTAGSGTWTTTGEYAHHYSTTEHVVGTWTDGKPLYERVIIDSRSGGFSTGEYEIYSDASTYHLIPNGLQGMLYNSAGSHYPVPWIGNNNSTSLHKNASGKIVLTVRNDTYNNYILEVIIRYTKTTD